MFLLIITYIGCQRELATVLLCAAIVSSGAIFVGHLANQNDLAPNYAGILMGITNTPGTIPAVLVPSLVGYLVESGVSINWIFFSHKKFHLLFFFFVFIAHIRKLGTRYLAQRDRANGRVFDLHDLRIGENSELELSGRGGAKVERDQEIFIYLFFYTFVKVTSLYFLVILTSCTNIKNIKKHKFARKKEGNYVCLFSWR